MAVITVEDFFNDQKQVKCDGVRIAYVNVNTGGVSFLPASNYRRAKRKPKFTEQEVIEEVGRQLDEFAG